MLYFWAEHTVTPFPITLITICSFGNTTSLFSGMTYSIFGRTQPGNMFQVCLKHHNNIKKYRCTMPRISCTKNNFLQYCVYRYIIKFNLQALQYRHISCTSPVSRFSQYQIYGIKFVLQIFQYHCKYSTSCNKNKFLQYCMIKGNL